MKRMKVMVLLTILLLLNFGLVEQLLAQQGPSHLVPLEEIRSELIRHSSRRADYIQEIPAVVNHEDLQKRGGKLADLERIEVALASLDDRTLEELAGQSRKVNDQLRADGPITWLVVTLVVILVVVVLVALAADEVQSKALISPPREGSNPP